MLNTKQINAIAKATKSTCDSHGWGKQVVVFEDGRFLTAMNSCDVIAVGNAAGGWDYPILRFSYPMTRKQVSECLAGNFD